MIITEQSLLRQHGRVVPGTDEWYLWDINESWQDPTRKGYERVTESPYVIRTWKGYAEADYIYLGSGEVGAPDDPANRYDLEEAPFYPRRFSYHPHWLTIDYRVTDPDTIKLYLWVKECHLEGLLINHSTNCWFAYTDSLALELECYHILEPFRKKVNPIYQGEIQEELNYLTRLYLCNIHNSTIDIIPVILHNITNLNKYITDTRPLPSYQRENNQEDYKLIEVAFIQWYLAQRIKEWEAYGGVRLFQRSRNLAWRNRTYLREFYWDLWGDIKNLRKEALEVKAVATKWQKIWRKHNQKTKTVQV